MYRKHYFYLYFEKKNLLHMSVFHTLKKIYLEDYRLGILVGTIFFCIFCDPWSLRFVQITFFHGGSFFGLFDVGLLLSALQDGMFPDGRGSLIFLSPSLGRISGVDFVSFAPKPFEEQ